MEKITIEYINKIVKELYEDKEKSKQRRVNLITWIGGLQEINEAFKREYEKSKENLD